MIEPILQVDKSTNIPIYLQLYEYFKREITDGNLRENDKLPSKRHLANHLQCSLNTVQAAYNQLLDEGYILSKARSGYFVTIVENISPTADLDKLKETSEDSGLNLPYDFSLHGIDENGFPIRIWRKLCNTIICRENNELFRESNLQGLFRLRSSIASYLHDARGVICSAKQIVISSGTEYLLQLLIQLFEHDYVYAIENPGYEKFALLFSSNRARFVPVQVEADGIDVEQIEKSSAQVVCITPSHQFPLGSVMPINRRIRLLNWAYSAPERYIIEDDYDSEFRYIGKPIPSLQGLDSEGRVIYIGSFSKSLSPSLRISYMVIPPELMERYLWKMSFSICSAPVLEQEILHRFIDNGYYDRHLNRMRKLYRQKREVMVNTIQQMMPNTAIIGANAGLHLVLKVNNGMSEDNLIERAKIEGVQVYGISSYFYDTPPARYHDVVALGFAALEETEIVSAITLLRKAWFD
ncbi:MAG: GntR family transcriptional regulator [Firmicutes bacterium HGW-Firmicutes-9]|jgi:GntR family transcriptional regulator/MocR family aminotransferase|nr:MAG: GntR family transcriptional regulator [Firmicutes bacterium HGW-Firmicutes-9]